MNIDKSIYEIDKLIECYPKLIKNKNEILDFYNILLECYKNGNKVLIAGNGGSAADSEHIVGELMKGFKKSRKLDLEFVNKLEEIDEKLGKEIGTCLQGTLETLSLCNHQALNTAFSNDVNGNYIFAQQVYGYGKKKDVFWGISTSGNSLNIIAAAIVAKAKGMKIISMTGEKKSELGKLSDVCIKVPEKETYKIQELHLPIYHCICSMLENEFW